MAEETFVPVDRLTYEEAFSELEQLVASLEREEHPLETALALYERGQQLLQHCRRLLEEAELKISLVEGGEAHPWQPDEDGLEA